MPSPISVMPSIHSLNCTFRTLASAQWRVGMLLRLYPRDDADPDEIARRQARVNESAGLAGAAVPLTGTAIAIAGIGEVDPISAWQTIAGPKPILEASVVVGACDMMISRLKGMIAKVEAEPPPAIGAEAMHPSVWGAASKL